MSNLFGGGGQASSSLSSTPVNLFGNPISINSTSQAGQTSSIFGGGGGQASSSTAPVNLFGNPITTNSTAQAGQTSNIFGGLGGSQPQQGSSAFEAAGPSTAASKPFSFPPTAITSASQNSSGGGYHISGALGDPNTMQAAPGSTSFPTSGATPAPQTSTGPSLNWKTTGLGTNWSVPGATTASSQPSLPTFTLGGLGNNNSTTLQPQSFGTFGTSGGSNQQPATQQQNGQPPPPKENASQSAYFQSLLEKNRKRDRSGEDDSGFGDVPSLQLGLGDIAKRAKALSGVGAQSQGRTGTDSRAHYLLAASGVNPGSAFRDLDALNAQTLSTSTQQLRPDRVPDPHKYVEQLQQQSTLKLIQEGISRAHRNFDAYLEENIDINWEAQRRKLYEHFGLIPKGADKLPASTQYSTPGGKGSFGKSSRGGSKLAADGSRQDTPGRSVFGRSGMQKSVIGTPGLGSEIGSVFRDVAENSSQGAALQDDRLLRDKQSRYAEKVQRLNEARLQEQAYPLLQEFANVEGQPGGDSPSQLLDAYRALVEIVEEGRTLRERQFAKEYLDEADHSANALTIRKKILGGSRRALEKQFYAQVESLVARNPREASLGGVPTVTNKVRAYIRLRNIRKDLVPDGLTLQKLNDDYCWALIFFLLRSGFITEAAEYVTTNSVSFRALDRNFVTYITQYASSTNQRLQSRQAEQMNKEYMNKARASPENSLDPYRMACYKVIGRCDLSKRSISSVSQGVEDWIWLQFTLAREVNRAEEAANEVYGLEQVRETIREIGQRHFSKGSDDPGGYGTYFYLQILGGMFEHAVAYLYSHSYIAAVHFAIALDYYGLLRVSDFFTTDSELLTNSTRELPQISFGRMVGYYTRDFRAGNVVAAVDYLTLICLNADLPGDTGRSQASLCHEALRELVLETREFAQLLGDIRSDGTRIRGAIEQRLQLIGIADKEAFLRTVTLQAASIADDNGRTTDAVLLYHLAEDYDNVITIINRALSDAIAVDLGQVQLRLQPLKPRTAEDQQQEEPVNSSLSLTTVNDPSVLARNMISLYNTNALYYQKIRATNREACGVLLRISEAKAKVESGHWAEALDIISSLNILPLSASASIPIIRSHANTIAAMPPTLSRLIGPLLLWTITCIARQRETLAGEGENGGFETETRRAMREELVRKAKDLMVFVGLVQLRLGRGVRDGIADGLAEVGVY